MEDRIRKFIEKKKIPVDKIMYVIRQNKNTYIYTSDGYIARTYFSMKSIIETIASEGMKIINKGTAVNLNFVTDISNGKYTMTDGRVFDGRVRTPGEHKKNGKIIKSLTKSREEADNFGIKLTDGMTCEEIREKFSILDDLPIPFAVFEIVFDNGKAVDLLFRYLNSKMAEFCECTTDGAMGRSFYSILKNGDRKWLEINGEVAVTGEAKSIHRFSPEFGKYLSMYYFCPAEGYSACAVVK